MVTYNSKKYIFCGLFSALIAICSQLAIPVGPVPITLGTFSVFLAGVILGPRYGMLSVFIWVLLGAFGLPVFSLFRGGLSILVGPSGGYIVGYIAAAGIVGFFSQSFSPSFRVLIPSMILGNMACYLLGLAWFMYITKLPFWSALSLGIFPFLIGDMLKIIAAALFVHKLYPHVRHLMPNEKQ